MVVEWLLEVEKDGWRVVVGGCLRWLEVVEWLLEVLEGLLEIVGCWMVVGGYSREVGEE